MADTDSDQEKLSLEERIRAAKPGDAILIGKDESWAQVHEITERVRQERIGDHSRSLTQQISSLLVQLIRNEMERKP